MGLVRATPGNERNVTPWSLVLVPLSLVAVVGILVGISWLEQHLLSSPALIRYTARSRHMGPDTIELFVATQSEPLLRNVGRS